MYTVCTLHGVGQPFRGLRRRGVVIRQLRRWGGGGDTRGMDLREREDSKGPAPYSDETLRCSPVATGVTPGPTLHTVTRVSSLEDCFNLLVFHSEEDRVSKRQ